MGDGESMGDGYADAAMELRRLDDYQSWQVRWGGTSVLIDPWLTDDPIGGSFNRQHRPGYIGGAVITQEHVSAVLLCTGVSDHARPQTLSMFRDQTILGPKGAVAVARKVGCANTVRMRPGDEWVLPCPDGASLRITATRTGFPLGLIAIGYLIEARDPQGRPGPRLWIDPHLPGSAQAHTIQPIDLALLPCHAVRAVVMPVTAGPATIATVARTCQAPIVVATATDPRRDMNTWQRALYRVRGGAEVLQAELGAACRVILMTPGDVMPVEQGSPRRSARPEPTLPPGSV